MQIPEDLRYAENHEWARLEDDGSVRVGISDYAQDALGDIVYVDLPDVGMAVEAGEAVGEIEATKAQLAEERAKRRPKARAGGAAPA